MYYIDNSVYKYFGKIYYQFLFLKKIYFGVFIRLHVLIIVYYWVFIL